MKKLYSTDKYKRAQAIRIRKAEKRKRKKKGNKAKGQNREIYTKSKEQKKYRLPIIPPADFRTISNTEECLYFFKQMRDAENVIFANGSKHVLITLKHVTQIDYATISILTAISVELGYFNINVQGNFPDDTKAKSFILESGFLKLMYNEKGKRFPQFSPSGLICFEKGAGKLSKEDKISLSIIVKRVIKHLTGEIYYEQSIWTTILEVCGNSIEWSGAIKGHWLLGVNFEKDKVIFTATDIGKGILRSLRRRLNKQINDTIRGLRPDEILKRAFLKKYQSASEDINRNSGLPAINTKFNEGYLENLKVLTNNVILHFDQDDMSRTFYEQEYFFKGTFYQWEITSNCLSIRTKERNNG